MADVDVEVIGADEAFAQVDQMFRKLDHLLAPHAPDIASQSVEQLAGAVPYLTGALSESARFEPADQDGELYALALGGDDVPYAGWIEFGGSRGREFVAEGRYMEPTAIATADETLRAISSASQDVINAYPWTGPTE
jgi:hypothetical protein